MDATYESFFVLAPQPDPSLFFLDSSERIKLIISSLGVLISRLSFESVLE
ncbi:hypothetical protein BFJ71_g452 [Fusarium oxysporum]|uniref:Uncharacterized protein n=1 Tax=Fusarium oxysporum f. sp. cepae TaxID=396571 RepID=A0A3L6ND43_FUSOX|nr:hypothetical protein BFJ65_g9429 [Fusarium oxysporum f. sp. cepae]RKK60541.1 hypothetical protein BFJ67_g2106 [Fusarium oxysporum f. sp. cepae]RKL11005.1 hypothetical protein BFJ71_g452 [Fusarium oxysporum]